MPDLACVLILAAVGTGAALMACDSFLRWRADRARDRRRPAPRRD